MLLKIPRLTFRYSKYFIPKARYGTVADDKLERPDIVIHQYNREIRQIPASVYGGIHIITCLYSSGVGLKLLNAIRRVMDHIGTPVYLETFVLPQSQICDYYITEIMQSIIRNRVAIKCNFESARTAYGVNSMSYANNYINNSLDLFAGILKFKSFQGIKTRHDNIDMVIIYQNNRGDFANLEYEPVKGVVESIRVTHRPLMERLINYACKYAMRKGRKKLTLIHKLADEIEMSERVFLEAACKIEKYCPQLEFEQLHLRDAIQQIIKDPACFDVICLTDRFASPIASALFGICGGHGLFCGANRSEKIAVFEPAEIKLGLRERMVCLSSPLGVLAATASALKNVGLISHAQKIKRAVWKTTLEDNVRTSDLGGGASTTQVCDQIIKNITEEEACAPQEQQRREKETCEDGKS